MSATRLLPALALLALAACGDNGTDPVRKPATSLSGNLLFVSGVHGRVNVLVDGAPVARNVALGGAAGVTLSPTQHTVSLQRVGEATVAGKLVTLSGTTTALMVGTDAGGVLSSSIVVDTNGVVPEGATKLRVAHFAAAAAPISIWRTQPDYGTMIRVQFPFHYGDRSPYLQSTVGDWRVDVTNEVSAAGSPAMPAAVASSGPISIASGKSKTVVVVDGETPGTVKLVVVEP